LSRCWDWRREPQAVPGPWRGCEPEFLGRAGWGTAGGLARVTGLGVRKGLACRLGCRCTVPRRPFAPFSDWLIQMRLVTKLIKVF